MNKKAKGAATSPWSQLTTSQHSQSVLVLAFSPDSGKNASNLSTLSTRDIQRLSCKQDLIDCSCSHFVTVFVLSRLINLILLKPILNIQMASVLATVSSEDVCCGPWPNWAASHRPISSTQAFVTQSEENWAGSQVLLAADSMKSTLKKLYSHFCPEHVIFTITSALGCALRCFSWYHDLSRVRCSSAEILRWRASFCMQWFGSPYSKPSAGVLTCLPTWWPEQNQNKQSLLCGKSCSFHIILC